MGRHGRRSGAAVALTGIALAGGAAGAAPALAQPAAPAPPTCLIGKTPFLVPPTTDPKPDVATGGQRQCVDAATKDVLDLGDLIGYGLKRAAAAATTTTSKAPAATTTTTKAPATTTTTPAGARPTLPAGSRPAPTPRPGRSPAVSISRPAPTAEAAPGVPGVLPDSTSSEVPGGRSAGPDLATDTPGADSGALTPAGRSTLPAAAAPAAPAGPAGPAAGAPLVLPPAGGGAPAALPALGAAPRGAPLPFDQVIGSYDPAALLSPLAVPGEAAAPGEPALVETLGGDTSGVTSSSRVESLGLDGLGQGGGVAAALGVTIMSGLGGLALRHRILSRIRTAAVGAAPDPVDEHEA